MEQKLIQGVRFYVVLTLINPNQTILELENLSEIIRNVFDLFHGLV